MAEGYRKNLIDHLKKALAKGYKEDSLRWALLGQGYSDAVIDRAMKQAMAELSEEDKARFEKEKPKITYKVYDENNRQIKFKEPFWKRIFRK
jgi:homoserine kinase